MSVFARCAVRAAALWLAACVWILGFEQHVFAQPSADLPAVASPMMEARTDPAVALLSRRRQDDGEKPPPVTDTTRHPWMIRLSLGLQAGLVRQSGSSELRRPGFTILDLGYSPVRAFSLLLRFETWLSYEPFASQFVGLGGSYHFAPDGMFVTGVLGMSVLDTSFGLPGDSGEHVQGVEAQVELGQQWDVSQSVMFSIGAHFEVGTPWLRSGIETTDLGVGMFAAIAYH